MNNDFLQKELSRVSEWIRFSDKKIALLSTYYSVVLGVLISQKTSILQQSSVQTEWLSYFLYLILAIIGVSFFIGIFFLVKSIFPRLKNSLTDKSMFYFGGIANMKFVDYLTKLEEISETEVKEQIVEQIYTNSVIANQKMKNTQTSIKSFLVFFFFSMLFLLII